MPQITSVAIASSTIRADELAEGDIIKHFTGDIWQVINEPEYTRSGISFDAMWLDVATSDNTQTVTFAPAWRFELIAHQSVSSFKEVA